MTETTIAIPETTATRTAIIPVRIEVEPVTTWLGEIIDMHVCRNMVGRKLGTGRNTEEARVAGERGVFNELLDADPATQAWLASEGVDLAARVEAQRLHRTTETEATATVCPVSCLCDLCC